MVVSANLRRATIFAGWLVFWAATPCAGAAAPSAVPAVGMPAPEFTLTTIDGRTVRLSDYRGRTLVLNVWASWCPPCRLETPDLAAEARATGARGVAFLGVDSTETAPVVRAFAAAKGVPYPEVAVDARSAFVHDYAITNIPATFVIDPHGVLRAIHADNVLPRAQLHAYIAAAARGATAPLVSDEQRKLDAMVDASRFSFDGDPATVVAHVRDAAAAIAAAENEMDDAMDDPARDHDLVATHAQEEALRARAIAALTPLAQTPADRELLARLQGDSAFARAAYADAIVSYQAALAIDATDLAALGPLAYALSQTGDDAGAVRVDREIVRLAPSYASEIGLAQASAAAGDRAETLAAIDAAIPLAAARSDAALAWTHLYAGPAALAVGERARARTEYAAAAAAAARIPSANPRSAWYVERAQEGLLSLGLGSGTHAETVLTIAPWTGPDLPGSIASTYKYRVALAGAPGRTVTLTAAGLPRHWIASFCSDRVCAPFTVRVALPSSGVKLIEFQVIPDGPAGAGHPMVRVDATTGGERRSVSTTVG